MLAGTLPSRIEASAVKRLAYSTEIVETDGGNEQRNARWAEPRARWDITIPPCKRNSSDYMDTLALFKDALGSFDTFLFHDPVDCEDIEVRFDEDTLTVQGVGNLVTASFTLIEVR